MIQAIVNLVKHGRGYILQTPRGAGKARFNVATPTTATVNVQHTYYHIIYKQNPFNIISRGVQR